MCLSVSSERHLNRNCVNRNKLRACISCRRREWRWLMAAIRGRLSKRFRAPISIKLMELSTSWPLLCVLESNSVHQTQPRTRGPRWMRDVIRHELNLCHLLRKLYSKTIWKSTSGLIGEIKFKQETNHNVTSIYTHWQWRLAMFSGRTNAIIRNWPGCMRGKGTRKSVIHHESDLTI